VRKIWTTRIRGVRYELTDRRAAPLTSPLLGNTSFSFDRSAGTRASFNVQTTVIKYYGRCAGQQLVYHGYPPSLNRPYTLFMSYRFSSNYNNTVPVLANVHRPSDTRPNNELRSKRFTRTHTRTQQARARSLTVREIGDRRRVRRWREGIETRTKSPGERTRAFIHDSEK